MPEIITGDGTQPTPNGGAGVRVAVASIANTTPIVVTTTTAHNFYSGDTVELEGTGLTGLLPLWIVTVTGADTFSLNGSSAQGASTTGYCIDYQVQPAFQIPDPGEGASMVTLAPVLQGLANSIPWAYRNAGKYRLYNIYTGALVASSQAPPFANAWGFVAASGGNLTLMPYTGISIAQMFNNSTGPIPIVSPTDMLDITYTCNVFGLSVTGQGCAVYISYFQPPSFASPIAINSTTNASPVVVSCTGHGIPDQGYVGLANMAENFLNGVWRVTRIDANTYSLNGSVAPGAAGGAVGTGVRLIEAQLTASAQVISTPPTGVASYPLTLRATNFAFEAPEQSVWIALEAQPLDGSSSISINLLGPAQVIVYHYRPN